MIPPNPPYRYCGDVFPRERRLRASAGNWVGSGRNLRPGSGPAQTCLRAMVVWLVLFRVESCFGLLFFCRTRAGPKKPAHIPSTTQSYERVYKIGRITSGGPWA